MCLICGNVGCGRYVEGQHAQSHFQATQHTFAVEIETQRVWDYIGDGYVHRLIQNKTDGKLVEISNSTQTNDASIKNPSKVEAIWLEYDYLLSSQLETQRTFYEEQLIRFEKEKNEEVARFEAQTGKEMEINQQLILRLEKERKNYEKQIQKLNDNMKNMEEDSKFMKQVNESLTNNQKSWQEKIKQTEDKLSIVDTDKDKRIKELEEQVRDLMFFIEAQKKLETSSNELHDGQVIVVNTPTSITTPKKKELLRKKNKSSFMKYKFVTHKVGDEYIKVAFGKPYTFKLVLFMLQVQIKI